MTQETSISESAWVHNMVINHKKLRVIPSLIHRFLTESLTRSLAVHMAYMYVYIHIYSLIIRTAHILTIYLTLFISVILLVLSREWMGMREFNGTIQVGCINHTIANLTPLHSHYNHPSNPFHCFSVPYEKCTQKDGSKS